jgi:hypothetical protein
MLESWPDLAAIRECFESGPGAPCAFCGSAGIDHVTEAREPPECIFEAEREQESARVVMAAIRLALSAEWTAPGLAVACLEATGCLSATGTVA